MTHPLPVRVGHLDSAVDPRIVTTARQATTDRAGRILEEAPDRRPDPHGTETAAAILRAAPKAELYSIEVLPGGASVVRIVAGLRWALQHEVRVVCLAFGLPPENVVLEGLIGELCAAGALVVAAAGNDGEGTVRQPAILPPVLAVGACGPDGRVTPESGSLFAPGRGVVKPDLLAPSTNGTSLACAQVVGATAALWAERPSATAGDVRDALVSTARPLDPRQRRRSVAGALDTERARRWLAGAELGRGLPTGPDPSDHPRWIDPRLRRELERARHDRSISAVLLRRTTEVVELPAAELEAALEDPDLRAASSSALSVWTLTR